MPPDGSSPGGPHEVDPARTRRSARRQNGRVGGERKESNLATLARPRLWGKGFSGLANFVGTSWEHVHDGDPLALAMGTTFGARCADDGACGRSRIRMRRAWPNAHAWD